jgi:hypothetical protein
LSILADEAVEGAMESAKSKKQEKELNLKHEEPLKST